ncbi:MAG: hypothetical protein PVH19_14565 [Planctomycetia bacterium]|jgi:hypothetical protein
MKFFLAGIMQGSLAEPELHDQDYRPRIKKMLQDQFPDAEIYDPLANHSDSINYDDTVGRMVFFNHNHMCRDVDVLIAFVPEASMGTAIEMWEANQYGATVITISPMAVNWAVKFLSHALYPHMEAFEWALESGAVRKLIEERSQL